MTDLDILKEAIEDYPFDDMGHSIIPKIIADIMFEDQDDIQNMINYEWTRSVVEVMSKQGISFLAEMKAKA